MPPGMQRICGLYCWAPLSCSATRALKISRYSGVSGACCASPRGLLGSQLAAAFRTHWPEKGGNAVWSTAVARPPKPTVRQISATAPTNVRWSIAVPGSVGRRNALRLVLVHDQKLDGADRGIALVLVAVNRSARDVYGLA